MIKGDSEVDRVWGFIKRYKVNGLVLSVLIIGSTIYYINKISSQLEVPPTLYVQTSDETSKLGVGYYNWNINGKETYGSAMPYFSFDYGKDTTLILEGEGPIQVNLKLSTLSADHHTNEKELPFKLIGVKRFVKGKEEIVTDFEEDTLTIDLSEEEIAYYYEFELEFKQGTVFYGLKIVRNEEAYLNQYVSLDELPTANIEVEKEVLVDETLITLDSWLENILEEMVYHQFLRDLSEQSQGVNAYTIRQIDVLSQEAIKPFGFMLPASLGANVPNNYVQTAVLRVTYTKQYEEGSKQGNNESYEAYYVLGKPLTDLPWMILESTMSVE